MTKTDCRDLCCQIGDISRRKFLVGLTGAAALAGFPIQAALAGGHADALLLSCMDYRLIDDMVRYMDGRKLTNDYDHVILAGASLGAVSDKLNWGKTFWDHLDVAIKLHAIKKVIVMDHRDCGAYRVVFERDFKGDEETAIHREQLNKLKTAINQRQPTLQVELLMMNLDGTVENMG